MREVSNERLYYELRAQHRRLVAMTAIIMFVFLAFAIPLWLDGREAITYGGAAALAGFVVSHTWLLADHGNGVARRFMDLLSDADEGDWPTDLKRDLQERGEL